MIKITCNGKSRVLKENGILNEIIHDIEGDIESRTVTDAEIKHRDSKVTIITFSGKDDESNKDSIEFEVHRLGLFEDNPKLKDLLYLAHQCPNCLEYNTNKALFSKTLKISRKSIAALATAGVLLAGSYVVGMVVDSALEKEDQIRIEREKDLYINENGDDVRNLPSYNDGGRFIDSNHYVDSHGIKYFISSEGKYFEMGKVVKDNMTADELAELEESHNKGLR